MPGVTRSIVINAPVERVFAAFADYGRFTELIPEVKESRVERAAGEVLVHFRYKLTLFGSIRYTVRMEEEPPSRISWTLVEGELITGNRGSWTLVAAGEGKTRATYQIEITLGSFVPRFIINSMMDISLPKMLEAFKRWAERR